MYMFLFRHHFMFLYMNFYHPHLNLHLQGQALQHLASLLSTAMWVAYLSYVTFFYVHAINIK